jgi:hypothetical protein
MSMPEPHGKFSVYKIELLGSVIDRPETIGTKEKYWLQPVPGSPLAERLHLFKVGRPGTGENWSERVACEIAHEMGLPHAKYELASCMGMDGVISERFHPMGSSLFTANVLLARIHEDYDQTLRFQHVAYTPSTCLKYISRRLQPPIDGALTAADFFVGYLVLDALIGNTDRHHENWAVILESPAADDGRRLAPTYDHASCLGREMTDERRSNRLTTSDLRANVAAYAERARTAFYDAERVQPFTSRELMAHLHHHHRSPMRFWAQRAIDLRPDFFESIFDRIPSEWISNVSADFACAFLRQTQAMLREIIGV